MKRTFVIAKRAIVYALTLAMLVAAPVTVSAAETGSDALADFDSWINPYEPNPADPEIGTGTVTSSAPVTRTLTEEQDDVLGLLLSEREITMEKGDTHKLEASVICAPSIGAEQKKNLEKMIKWHVYKDIRYDYATQRYIGTCFIGEEMPPVGISVEPGDRTKASLYARDAGRAYIVCDIDDYASGIHFESLAWVTVNKYAGKITINAREIENNNGIVYYNHEYYLTVDVSPANDHISWYVSDEKLAAITYQYSYNGYSNVEFKVKKKTGTFRVYAVTDHGVSDSVECTIEAGKAPKAINIYYSAPDEEEVVNPKTITKNVTDNSYWGNRIYDLHYGFVLRDGDAYEDITDYVSWESSKPQVADVDWSPSYEGGHGLVLKINGEGTTKLTAKTQNGVKASVNVKVTSTLQSVSISGASLSDLYTGQSRTLSVTRVPVINQDKLSWSIEKVGGKANPYASINGSGLLKATNKTPVTDPAGADVTVVVKNKKGVANGAGQNVKIRQSQVESITISRNGNMIVQNNKGVVKGGKKDSIYVPNDYRWFNYDVKVEGDSGSALYWTSSKPAVAQVDGYGNVRLNNGGSTKIKAEGLYIDETSKKLKTIKAEYTLNALLPAAYINLDKNVIILNPYTGKKPKSINVKATLAPQKAEKGMTLSVIGDDAKFTASNSDKPNNTQKLLQQSGTVAGDTCTVVATTRSGAQATAKVYVVETTAAAANGKMKNDVFSEEKECTIAMGGSYVITPYIKLGSGNKKNTWVAAGTNNSEPAEAITYKPSKEGYVKIENGVIYGLKATGPKGITITAKTAAGKSFKLKVVVEDKK